MQWRVPLFNNRQTDVVAERMQIMQQRNHVGFIPYGPETGYGTDGCAIRQAAILMPALQPVQNMLFYLYT